MNLPILIVIAAIPCCALLCVWLAGPHSFLKLLDVPNERSLHAHPVARTGGVGIGLTLALGWLLLAATGAPLLPGWLWFVAGYGLVATISLADDYRHVAAGLRLSLHLGASLLPSICGFWLHALSFPGFTIPLPAPVGILLTTLFCGWMINLYNFMDGMDGFAGGMTLIGFGTLAALAFLGGAQALGLQTALIAAAALGFLLLNFPPAKLFLGDVGSAALGYAAAFCALWADRLGVAPLWISVLVFSPFIVDASVTLIRRALNHEKLWEAHRTHHYQRLVTAGWSHRRTVLAEYALMAVCAAAALLATTHPAPALCWTLIAGLLFAYALLSLRVLRVEQLAAAMQWCSQTAKPRSADAPQTRS